MRIALELAKYIVSKCVTDECPISNLQLQKILYYIQKEFLKNGNHAFPDKIEAWQFGPVVRTVYYRFSGYGAMPIMREYQVSIDEDYSKDEVALIDRIVEEKRVLDPWQLVEETHKPDGAWYKIYSDNERNDKIIPEELIAEED